MWLFDAESGRQSTPEPAALQFAANDVPLPSRPEELPTRSEKAMADSLPGSEYWLP